MSDITISAGPYSHTTTSGVHYSVDRPLSQEMVDLLHGLLQSNELEPNDVCSVTMRGESPPLFDTVEDRRREIEG